MSRKLPNYIRTHRKRFGLTQREVAFVLGVKSGTKISRYEKFARVPSLKTALALQALFGVPIAELFAGLYEQAEKETAKRAVILQQKMQKQEPEKVSKRKAEGLTSIEVAPESTKENL